MIDLLYFREVMNFVEKIIDCVYTEAYPLTVIVNDFVINEVVEFEEDRRFD